jgi:hypothetical protein
MSDVILVLFVEFIVIHPTEGLAPEGYGFVYRKSKNLSKLSGEGQVHHLK